MLDTKVHWEQIYSTKSSTDVSWYQRYPSLSLKLIEATGIGKEQGIIDVGGGTSVLVDCLLNKGFIELAVLDISPSALEIAKTRLGTRAEKVEWIEADATEFQPPHHFDLWHDRAVFHFLVNEEDRRKYVSVVKRTLVPGGHIIIATFAIDGPNRCSGLDTVQYDMESMSAQLGDEFELLEKLDEEHLTPGNKEQKFTYFMYRRKSTDARAAREAYITRKQRIKMTRF
jgi:ubiquinone/menaquinone biosynthesis C-methylase UbiE